ncbi:MAG: type II toxin-antitoxin system VapC family toxin [Rhodospirillales bacterium]|nr:type II toxin-antitoxin system VapC family toxin [Rhodospirillales bacterium]
MYRDESLAALARLPITIDSETDTYAWTTTLRLAYRFALTIYDAAYLELAQRQASACDSGQGASRGCGGPRR